MRSWIRKSELDVQIGRDSPVPTQVISNEEYRPAPQTRAQREVELRLEESSPRLARRLGNEPPPLSPHLLRNGDGIRRPERRLRPVLLRPGFGAHRAYGVDPEAQRNPLPDDYVDRLRGLAAGAGLGERSNLQYGWVSR